MLNSSLSVIVPAFNEADNVKTFIPEVGSFLKSLSCPYEIIVVDDGSGDSTPEVVKSLAKEIPNLRLCIHSCNLGIGAALKTGFKAAQNDLIFWLPADGQIPIAELKRFLDNFAGFDMVISVYTQRQDSFLRFLISWTWRILVRAILNYNLEIQGPYLFKREILKSIPLHSNTGLMNLEFPNKAKRRGLKINTVQIRCESRRSGKSKVLNRRAVMKIFREMFNLRRADKEDNRKF